MNIAQKSVLFSRNSVDNKLTNIRLIRWIHGALK